MLADKKQEVKGVARSEYDDYMPSFYKNMPIRDSSESVIDQLKKEIPMWHPANPVLLDLPTGTGKTTFVYDVLLPEALARGKNLLLVSNRVALSSQQKYVIMERTKDPNKKLLTEEGVRQKEDFGSIRVITYHRLPALIHDKGAQAWIANLAYVVMDEAHFFAADSIFNEKTDYYLKAVCERFCHAIRVYMTGTSWEILKPLADAEMTYYRCRTPVYTHPLARECYRYTLPQSFDSYNLCFFKDLGDLVEQITRNPQEKWLIFTDSKERGKQFCKELKTSYIYLDASSKETSEWQNIVKNMRFDTQVLVTTAALDNGINIIDDDVKHVAIVTDNRVSLIQMMGRKRLKPREHVNLWICDLPLKTISVRYQKCVEWLNWYERVENCPRQYQRSLEKELWNSDNPTLRKLFRLGNTGLFPNKLAKYVIGRRQLFFGRILRGETTFKKEVETWLGLDSHCESAEAELVRFYREYADQPLAEELQMELRAILWRCYQEFGGKDWRKDREKTVDNRALTNFLTKMGLPYEVEKENNHWRLIKVDGEDRIDD